MNNFIKLLRTIVFVIVVVFSFCACNSKNDSLDRTSWTATFQGVKIYLRFNSPNFTISAKRHTFIEGSYSISDTTVLMSGIIFSENRDNAFAGTGTLSSKTILSVNLGHETIKFTRLHPIKGG